MKLLLLFALAAVALRVHGQPAGKTSTVPTSDFSGSKPCPLPPNSSLHSQLRRVKRVQQEFQAFPEHQESAVDHV